MVLIHKAITVVPQAVGRPSNASSNILRRSLNSTFLLIRQKGVRDIKSVIRHPKSYFDEVCMPNPRTNPMGWAYNEHNYRSYERQTGLQTFWEFIIASQGTPSVSTVWARKYHIYHNTVFFPCNLRCKVRCSKVSLFLVILYVGLCRA